MARASFWRVGLLLLLARSAVADPVPAGDSAGSDSRTLRELSIEDLLEVRVHVATKTELQAAEAPAVVTVVTAEEIQARGYTSLAEVLRDVPGFYDVYDGVTHNVGVRGINGGDNASGSVIKLMIDGHPVDYRPTTGNFFGEELIPMPLIARVEIIRGPASALYGANAFLGVVNVITKNGADLPGARLIGQGLLVREHPGGGGGLVLGGSAGPVDVLVGATYVYVDRSGLKLPASSPLLALDTTGVAARAPSRNDTAQPVSVFGKLSLGSVLYGRLTLMASLQSLDSHGEFQSTGALTHDTRITALNQNYRLSYEVSPVERLTLTISGHYFDAGPTSRAHIDVGRADYLMLPSLGARGGGFTAEGRVRAHHLLLVTLGIDFVDEKHLLETYDQKLLQPVFGPDGTTVLRSVGTIIPGDNHGATSTFYNVGTFVQGILTPRPEWTVVGGLRLDDHNIYGANLSARAGVVYAAHELSLKLLYGSAFKAPSAEQLYARPIGFGGIEGNPTLQAQTAHTFEASGGYQLPHERGSIAANLFATDVIGRVEFLPHGNFVQAENIQDEWVIGGELDSRFIVTHALMLRFAAGVAHTVSRTTGEALLGKPAVENPLFPTVQLHLSGDYMLPWAGLRVAAELSYIGPRPASFENSLIHGTAYTLDGYAYTAVAVSSAALRLIPKRPTSVSLRVWNLINYHWVEPGFGGVDVPIQGVTAWLTIVQPL